MTTATPTRTLADAFLDRLHEEDQSDKLGTAIADAISTMAPYVGETEDLRPSEVVWLDQLATEAGDAGRAAALAAIVAVFERELPRLLPSREDGNVPPHLWEQGGDAINGDAEIAAESADR